MNEFTENFLEKCKEVGITKVAICVKHKAVPSSMEFAYSPIGWVFAFQPKKVSNKYDGYPIHTVVRDLGIAFGACDLDGHQITSFATENFDYGAYILKSGKWAHVES